ncbi:ATP-binding protein [Brevibacillus centrosporus]|uniref:ATP-binding protein n=1 Tax=Brevibacillus centrosporus TaxID=54910 RepID=UPI003B01F27E
MNNQHVQLNELIQISSGHILYFYEDLESYLENAVSYIRTGIEQGHHLLLIDTKQHLWKIGQKLKQETSQDRMGLVHFVDSHEFYAAHHDFHSHTILEHFKNILRPLLHQNLTIRTWALVEWKEQEEILQKLKHFETISDHTVNTLGLLSVCAYNGRQVSASFMNEMMKTHEYFMTDKELKKSSFYKKRSVTFPSLSLQEEQKRIWEQNKHLHNETKSRLKTTTYQLESFITRNLDPILIFNDDNQVIRTNASFEKVFGWSSEEIMGVHAEDLPLIPHERKWEVQKNQAETLLGRYIQGFETIRKTKAGNERNVKISCFPLRDESDQVSGWASIIRDFTEEKQAQELLLRTEKLSVVSELAAGIAHEIRNPLTSVKGFLQLLKSQALENGIYYDIMLSEIDRIDLILGEMLLLAKPQIAHFQRKNVCSLLKEVVTLLEAQANMCNVQIVMKSAADDIYVTCEENQLKQVCINFIKNAIEAMPDGGELTIQLEVEKETVSIRFIDQGVGIPKDVLEKLGQPFFTTKEKGTGLGFMVSKKIIENHDGTVHVSSEEQKGTTIEIRLSGL